MFLGDVGGQLVHRDVNAAKPAQGLTRGNVNPLHLPSSMGGSGSCVKNADGAGSDKREIGPKGDAPYRKHKLRGPKDRPWTVA